MTKKTFNSLGYKFVKDEILGSVLKYEEGGFLAKHCDLSNANFNVVAPGIQCR
jgi:hypothetical protein